jgi:hypothetical protein
MTFPQASYSRTPALGLPGDIATALPHRTITAKANGAIPFGCAVMVLNADSSDGFNDVMVAVPPTPAVDADSIILTGVSTAGIQIYLPDGGAGLIFDGAVAGKTLQYGYLLEMVCNMHTDWNATTAEVWGYDVEGRPVYDTITIAADTGGTFLANTDQPFCQVTRFEVPAQTGTNGTFTLGNQAAMRQVNARGIAVRNQALQTDGYVDGDEVIVLVQGHIWARPTGVASGSVTRGQIVTVRATAGVGERQGELSNVVDAGDNGYWPRAKWRMDADVYHADTNPNAVAMVEVL